MALIEATFGLRKSVAAYFFKNYALPMFCRAFLVPVAPGLLITGCTSPETYPSLLPRAVESAGLEEPAATAPASAAPDPALDARIRAAVQMLEERADAFDAAGSRAERAVSAAAGASPGSEPWLNAHVALAELDALRSTTTEVIIVLDDLASERALSLAPDYQPLSDAAARARATAERQAKRIAALQGRLSPA